MSSNELDVKLVQAAVANATVNFPDILLRAEVEAEARQLEERLREQNVTVEQYLSATGKSVEQILEEMSSGARVRISNSLTLAQIAREESITVDDADVDVQIEARAVAAKVSAGAVRKYAEQNNTLNQYRDQAMTQKILAFLRSEAVVSENSYTADEMRAANEALTSVEPVAVDPAADEAPAKPKRKTAKAKEATEDAVVAETEGTDAKPAPRKRTKKAEAEG
jgi:trigger factor